MLRLTLLPPDIVEAILDGRQPDGLMLPALLEPFHVQWALQRAAQQEQPEALLRGMSGGASALTTLSADQDP